jgi:GAF domain
MRSTIPYPLEGPIVVHRRDESKLTDERAVRVGVAFARQASAVPASRLCSACVEILDVSGAGVTIMSGTNSGPVCSSDERMGRLEDLQFGLGEGPCRDAYDLGQPVTEPDLEHRLPDRWPHYTRSALEMGARGVFAFPLRIGNNRVGVLTLYQDTAGPLSSEQTADSLVVADVLAQTMASIQSRSKLPQLAIELSDANSHRAEVHQACGMAAIQLGVNVAEALVRMRAHAYVTNQSVADIAQQIVARTLRLGDDRPIERLE